MSKLIALEWDARQARIAVGNPRGSDVVVERAFTVELSASEGNAAPTIAEVSEQLAAALGDQGLTGNDALIALPRSSIELRTLNLPQAPPEEIPDMVRFQAMQAFTSIGEEWPVDYVELDAQEDSLNVLATVVSPQLVKETQQVCLASELKERCLVLRPFAAVSLLHRFEAIDVYRTSLIVDLLPENADLTVISNGNVVFMRSVRMPQHGQARAQAKALVGELRRTIGAAQNQMGGTRIEQVVICGGESENAALCESVSDALSLDVVTFDPFEAVRHTRDVKTNMPEHAGRFAPVLGMLACEATGAGHTIDFLNPRKRPDPPSKAKRNSIVATVAVVVALTGTFLFLSQRKAMDDEIAQLTEQSGELDDVVKKARTLIGKADTIKSFEQGDITWLDEIREVAKRMPNADDVILREVRVGVDPIQGGRMTLIGNVSSTDVIAQLEEDLRFGSNRVKGYRGTVDPTQRDYPYQMETMVFVPSDVLEDGHSLGRPPLPAGEQLPEGSSSGDADGSEDVDAEDIDTENFTSQSSSEPAVDTGDQEDPAESVAAEDMGEAATGTEQPPDEDAAEEGQDETATEDGTALGEGDSDDDGQSPTGATEAGAEGAESGAEEGEADGEGDDATEAVEPDAAEEESEEPARESNTEETGSQVS